MPRKPLNHLFVTDEQYVWINATISRISHRITSVGPKKPSKEQTACLAFYNKLLEQRMEYNHTVQKYVVNTTRVEARILQKIAKDENAALVAKIIPGYLARIGNEANEEARVRLTAYKDKATQRAAMLVDLINTINQRLND